MAEFTQTIGTNDAFQLKIIISELQDDSNLLNNVTVVGYICKTKDVGPFNTTSTASLSCEGETYETHPAFDLRGNQGYSFREVIRHTFAVTHDAGGTKSVTISFSFDGKLSEFYPNGELKRDVTLTPIYVGDDFTIKKDGVETTSLTLGVDVNINVTNYSNTRSHKIEFIYGGRVDTSSLKNTNNFTTHPTVSFRTNITSYTSVEATARLYTYNASGSSLLGYKDKKITLIIPDTEEYKPSFTLEWGFRSHANNKAVIEKIKELGAYVQGFSEIYMNISNAEPGAGATLKKATLYMSDYATLEKSGDSKTYTIYPGVLTIAGNRTLRASVYDSRGRYTAKPDKIIYVAPYSQPRFKGTITRQDIESDTVNDNIVITGLDLSSMIQSSISKSDGSTIDISTIEGVSTPSFSVEYMRLGDSTWTSVELSGSNAIIKAQKSSPYSIRISIIDYLGVSKEIYLSVASAKIDFHMRNGKVRFGSYIDDTRDVTNSFEVDWQSYFNDKVYLKKTLYLKDDTDNYITLREYIKRIINGG